jgi:DedD protein
MASRFQSRLIGTIILVAVGVIILPDILDGQKSRYKDDIASIPLKPDIDETAANEQVLAPETDSLSLPPAPVETTGEKPDNASSAPDDTVAVKPREVPQTTNPYKESAWIIQLMALKNADNAKKLVLDLQKRGYQAHSKQENGYTRVIIGPDVSKHKLERQLTELEKITGAKGQLMKFRPLNP